MPHNVLWSCLGLASLPSRPIGELSRRRWDSVETKVSRFNTCKQVHRTNFKYSRIKYYRGNRIEAKFYGGITNQPGTSTSMNPYMNPHPLIWILIWILIHLYESSHDSSFTSMNPHMIPHPLLWILIWILIHLSESSYESSSTSMNPHKNLRPLLLIVED